MSAKRKNYDAAVTAYDSGLSIQEVANIHGITRQAMHKILRIRGVDFRSNLKFGAENHFYNGGYKYDVRVRSVTQTAINNGSIHKEPCEVCGNEVVDAHHDDYNEPLLVRWLCRKHHAYWHEHSSPKRRVVILPPMNQKEIAKLGGIASGAARRGRSEQ